MPVVAMVERKERQQVGQKVVRKAIQKAAWMVPLLVAYLDMMMVYSRVAYWAHLQVVLRVVVKEYRWG